jgi:hypothetical protein
MARTPPKKSAKFVDSFRGRVAVGLTCAALGFAISALSPFWPTEPDIEAGAASLASPFDIPFSIKNNSKVFKITNLRISCELVEVTTSTNAGLSNVALVIDATNYILPTEAPIYVCPLNRMVRLPSGAPITKATMRFRYSYSQSVLWSETSMTSKESKEFRLLTGVLPQRWTADRALN